MKHSPFKKLEIISNINLEIEVEKILITYFFSDKPDTKETAKKIVKLLTQ